jgi:hypothetical protein
MVLSGQQQFNYDGDRTDLQASVLGEVTFHNYISARAFATRHPPTYDPYRTRGGVIVRDGGYTNFSATLSGDSRKRLGWRIGAAAGPNIADRGRYALGNLSLVVKPADNVRFSLGPSYLWDFEPRAFVTNVDDATATQFGGMRSVFAELEQHNLSMSTRLDATFTPDLTLELFLQPLVASGRYRELKEHRAPRTSETLVYGRDVGTVTIARDETGRATEYRLDPDGAGAALPFTVANPDFNVRSLRGTAVMRWEYRPGSTLFFVWTQQRAGSDVLGDFDFGRDGRALFRDRPVNVFQLKASYWLGM